MCEVLAMAMIGNIATIRSVQRYHNKARNNAIMAQSCGRGLSCSRGLRKAGNIRAGEPSLLRAREASLLRENRGENPRPRVQEQLQHALSDRPGVEGKALPFINEETAGFLMVHTMRGPWGFFGVSQQKRYVLLDPEKGTLSYLKGPSVQGQKRKSFSLSKLKDIDFNPSGKLFFLYFEKDPNRNLPGGFLKVGAETEADFSLWKRALSRYKSLPPC